MSKVVYLILSVATFLAGAALHVSSYFREMPRSLLTTALCAGMLLCIPLMVLFLRLKKAKGPDDLWQTFWKAVIARCPRWIWGCMSIAWLLAMIAFIRGIISHEPAPMVFHTALVLIPISAAMSYSVTLCRQ